MMWQWVNVGNADYPCWRLIDDNCRVITETVHVGAENRRLIASAPQLLEACREMLFVIATNPDIDQAVCNRPRGILAIQKMSDAWAQATGELIEEE